MNHLINNLSNFSVVIAFSYDRILRGLHLNVHILPLSDELEELFKCGYSFTKAHIVGKYFFIRQVKNVQELLHRVREMMIHLSIIPAMYYYRHAIFCKPNLEERYIRRIR